MAHIPALNPERLLGRPSQNNFLGETTSDRAHHFCLAVQTTPSIRNTSGCANAGQAAPYALELSRSQMHSTGDHKQGRFSHLSVRASQFPDLSPTQRTYAQKVPPSLSNSGFFRLRLLGGQTRHGTTVAPTRPHPTVPDLFKVHSTAPQLETKTQQDSHKNLS